MRATLRFTTVNPRSASTIKGRLAALSPTRIAEQHGLGYFLARIVIDNPQALALICVLDRQ